MRQHIDVAVDGLPSRQRAVITLRDIDGYSSEEVCAILGISLGNQRVLLHRARAAVRARLEVYFSAQLQPTQQNLSDDARDRILFAFREWHGR